MNRRAFTLAELLTSLVLLSAVVGLATHAIVGQLRFLGGVSEVAALRGELAQVDGVTRSLLWSASPSDIVAAQDSALELRGTIGSAVVCDGTPGVVTIAAPTGLRGNTLSAFTQQPDVGDRVVALFDDSAGTTWLTFSLASAPATTSVCSTFPAVHVAWRLMLQEQVAIPAGSVVRVLRPVRLSLYKASDGLWYLGIRDWNGSADHFNTIQPVAGPLRPYSSAPSSSGLSFTYRDSADTPLPSPTDPARVASVTIVARAETNRVVQLPGISTTASGLARDSMSVTIALRNAP